MMSIKGTGRGYTLVELLVVMLIFSVVMTLISVSFSSIVRSSGKLVKSAETDIGGLIGLELMRADLELAGFGLPWKLPAAVSYKEVEDEDKILVNNCQDGCPGAKAFKFNDFPDLDAPTAYRIGNNAGYNGSDYLVLKGTAIGASAVSRSWGYLNYSSTGAVVKTSRSEPELLPVNSDRVIVLKTGATAGAGIRELVTVGSSFSLNFKEPLPEEFLPSDKHDLFLVYGVATPQDNGLPLHFPFNRSDYYISRKDDGISPSCNSFTGVLYKTTINHSWPRRTYTEYPVLDCAADMQVVLYMDTNRDGIIDYHPDPDDHIFTAQELREELKEVRVYILAQQGRRDSSYQYPVTDPDKVIVVGDPELDSSLGRVWSASAMKATFGPDWHNYRWKLYSIAVQPKNL